MSVVLARASRGGRATTVLVLTAGTGAGGRADLERGGARRPALPATPRAAATATFGAPLYTYSRRCAVAGGALARRGRARTRTVAAPEPVLVVLDPATGSVLASFAHSSLPSWSPDGSTLAFSRSAWCPSCNRHRAAHEPAGRATRWWRRPSGARSASKLVLDVAGRTDLEHLELADPVVLARYALPGVTGASSDPVISPDGVAARVPALHAADARDAWLAGLGPIVEPPRLLDPTSIQPSGSPRPGTLARDQTAAGRRRRPSCSSVLPEMNRSRSRRVRRTAPSDTVVVAPSGRQLVYLSPDADGTVQAYVENADGSQRAADHRFRAATLIAAAVTVSG